MRNIFNLDKRLEICANMVDSGKKFIDIGTDHAYLPIWLVLNGIIDEAIAADIREEPLKKAKKNIIKYGLQDKIKTIKTDGLNNINKDDCENIVIAGMGADTIISIIDNAYWLKECKNLKLILQPMTAAERLRRYLSKNNYNIYKEIAVESNSKVYSVMEVKIGKSEYLKDIYPYVGKIFETSPVNYSQKKATLTYSEKEILNLLNRIKGLKVKNEVKKANFLNEIIKKIEKEKELYCEYNI